MNDIELHHLDRNLPATFEAILTVVTFFLGVALVLTSLLR